MLAADLDQFCFALLRSRTFAIDNGIYQGKKWVPPSGSKTSEAKPEVRRRGTCHLSSDFLIQNW
jgi:hypothetical protein